MELVEFLPEIKKSESLLLCKLSQFMSGRLKGD